MFDVSILVTELCKRQPKHLSFEPTDVQLSDLAISASKTNEEPPRFVSINADNQPQINSFLPQFPSDRDVVAIDTTSIVLGGASREVLSALSERRSVSSLKAKKRYRKWLADA